MGKIGRNAPCPCGSGKKYKKCCLGKQDNPDFSEIENIREIYKQMRKEGRFKECIHPDKGACSEKLIKAHSIQNNKVLSRISDNGKVYMPCPKTDIPLSLQNEYGRKEASVFTGFCINHDKTVFQPIEDELFSGTDEQIFLYIYRAFALEYHKKKEVLRGFQYIFKNKPSLAKSGHFTKKGESGSSIAVKDFEFEK